MYIIFPNLPIQVVHIFGRYNSAVKKVKALNIEVKAAVLHFIPNGKLQEKNKQKKTKQLSGLKSQYSQGSEIPLHDKLLEK